MWIDGPRRKDTKMCTRKVERMQKTEGSCVLPFQSSFLFLKLDKQVRGIMRWLTVWLDGPQGPFACIRSSWLVSLTVNHHAERWAIFEILVMLQKFLLIKIILFVPNKCVFELMAVSNVQHNGLNSVKCSSYSQLLLCIVYDKRHYTVDGSWYM